MSSLHTDSGSIDINCSGRTYEHRYRSPKSSSICFSAKGMSINLYSLYIWCARCCFSKTTTPVLLSEHLLSLSKNSRGVGHWRESNSVNKASDLERETGRIKKYQREVQHSLVRYISSIWTELTRLDERFRWPVCLPT